MRDLTTVAARLVAPGKGILAADESITTMSARLAAAGVEPTEGARLAYREMLITTPALAAGISGVILCAETFGQQLADGTPFPAAIRRLGMLPGIKVDTGARPLDGCPGETITEGLDGLQPRLQDFARRGAAFAKWRAVLRIGPGMPSAIAVRANAQALGRYAAACQHAGLVPVVEPEVLMDGPHSLAQCEAVTSLVLLEVVTALQDYGAAFGAMVLKPNMVLPGSLSGGEASPDQVAEATIATLGGLPATLGGVAFLSGGQRPEQATANLAALQSPLPGSALPGSALPRSALSQPALSQPAPLLWPLTFSFGRALVEPALAAWQGSPAGVRAGQRALARRTAMNVAALQGRYAPELELDPA
jgi:fructose-bisphosphate aldolase class I